MICRVASVCFTQKLITHYDEFILALQKHILFAKDSHAQLIVFPEYLTASLLAIHPDWTHWTMPFLQSLQTLAQKNQIAIVAGTHLLKNNSAWQNASFFVSPSGNVITQTKIHPTPFEEKRYALQSDHTLQIIETPFGKIAILICYDIEFPALAQFAAQQDVDILCVPSFTDDEAGFHRVSLTARARAIENQLYVVHSTLVGGLTHQRDFEQACGKAAIYSPCDIGFPSHGIIAESHWNQDFCLVAELDLKKLKENRKNGSVLPRQYWFKDSSISLSVSRIV